MGFFKTSAVAENNRTGDTTITTINLTRKTIKYIKRGLNKTKLAKREQNPENVSVPSVSKCKEL